MFSEIQDALLAAWPWEALAVVSLIAYLVLAIRQSVLCWAASIVGTTIYFVLTWQVGLYMDALLQVFYLAMAAYGWYHWSRDSSVDHPLPIVNWPLAFHVLPLFLITSLTLISGYLLSAYSDASLPYVDSFATWGAIFATWMVARKVLQNWHYWFVIDSLCVFLYVSKGLWFTAALYLFYLFLIVLGLRAWREAATS